MSQSCTPVLPSRPFDLGTYERPEHADAPLLEPPGITARNARPPCATTGVGGHPRCSGTPAWRTRPGGRRV